MIHVELSIVTLVILYYSSRLVLFLHLWQRENAEELSLTAQNMLYYFIPGTIEYDLFVESGMRCTSLTMIALFLVLTPLLHIAYVFYCCYKQSRSHYYTSEDFPWFVPMSVIEIFESAPQRNKQVAKNRDKDGTADNVFGDKTFFNCF